MEPERSQELTPKCPPQPQWGRIGRAFTKSGSAGTLIATLFSMAFEASKQRQVVEKLRQMAPQGEQFVCCVHGMTGPRPGSGLDEFSSWVPILDETVLIMRKHYFFAVTSQHVVLTSASRFTNLPVEVLGSWPRNQFPISNVNPGEFYVQWPGSNKPTRLNVCDQNDFEQMMAAVNQGGGIASGASPPPVPPPPVPPLPPPPVPPPLPPPLPPAGWYADPNQPTGQRYWDGAQWTQHAAP